MHITWMYDWAVTLKFDDIANTNSLHFKDFYVENVLPFKTTIEEHVKAQSNS